MGRLGGTGTRMSLAPFTDWLAYTSGMRSQSTKAPSYPEEIGASSRQQLRPVLVAARQKASFNALCLRTHADGPRIQTHPLVFGPQPSSTPVVVDVRRH